MPGNTARLRIVIDASTDAGRAEIKQLAAELRGAGAATDAFAATQNKLALAAAEAQGAAQRLADAQRLLSMATDPDDQAALAREVAKAQVALDKEAAEVDQLTRELDELGDEASQAAGQTRALGQAQQGGAISFTEISSAINLARQGLQLLGQGYDAIVGQTVSYAKQVRDLSRTIGSSAEESSKLIQVADDVLISYETLTSAFEAGIRKGVSPTVEGLADISEQFLKLPPGIERSAFAMDKFGRSGNDLQPLLELGPQRIREMGEAAEETGLVLSQDAVDAAREYEKAMDSLEETWQSFAIFLGTKAIPAITELTRTQLAAIDVNNLLREAYLEGTISQQDQHAVLLALRTGTMSQAEAIEFLEGKLFEERRAVEASSDRLQGLADAYQAAETKDRDLAAAAERTALRLESQSRYTRALAGHTYELEEAFDEVGVSMDVLHAAMDGAVGNEVRAYEESQADLQTQIEETKRELEKYQAVHGTVARNTVDGAEATRELTIAQAEAEEAARGLAEAQQALSENTDPEQQLQLEAAVARAEGKLLSAQGAVDGWNAKLAESGGTYVVDYTTKLGEIQTKLDGLQGEYDANAAAHEEATRRILYGIVEQQIAQQNLRDGVQGFTKEQQAFLNDLALGWGLVDQATYDATTNIMAAVARAAADGNWDLVRRLLEGIDTAVRNIPTSWETVVTTTYRSVYLDEAPKGAADTSGDFYDAPAYAPGGIGGASGLDLMVPPGFPNDSFGPIWAQSGERVTITPNGAAPGGNPVYITVDARGAADPKAIERAGYEGAKRAMEEARMNADVIQRARMG